MSLHERLRILEDAGQDHSLTGQAQAYLKDTGRTRQPPPPAWKNKDVAKFMPGIGDLENIDKCIDAYVKDLRGQQEAKKLMGSLLPITVDDEHDQVLLGDQWEDVELEVTLDSGCVDHVMDSSDAPGYCILESAGSKRTQNFVVGNGHKVPNRGETHLNLEADVNGNKSPLQAIFQVADITRPLMSVSKMADQGLECLFKKEVALVMNNKGEVVCEFQRRGGLYVTTMKLRRPKETVDPQPFPRQGR